MITFLLKPFYFLGFKPGGVRFQVDKNPLGQSTKSNPIKVHITAYQPYGSYGGGDYAMSYVKQITTSTDFNEMSEIKRQCQNRETVDECRARHIKEKAEDHCNCIPWILSGTEEDREVCSPHGYQCFVDTIAQQIRNRTYHCEVNCQGLYLDVEHNQEESSLPMEDDGLSKETFAVFDEYKSYRQGDVDPLHQAMRRVLQDKSGWPFKTSQNIRVPYFSWSCPGPAGLSFPEACLDDKALKGNPALINYCQKMEVSFAITRDNCTDPEDEKLAEICVEKRKLWNKEDECATTNPRNMDNQARKECRCKKERINNAFTMKGHFQLVKIYFNTGSFDKVTKSAKTNFVSQLSLIGGTFGLFTGFSILSGIEILFFIGKVLLAEGKTMFVFNKPIRKKRKPSDLKFTN